MRNQVKTIRLVLTVVLAAALGAPAAWASPSLTLVPASGEVSALPGLNTGWGFTLTDATDYVVLTGSSFSFTGPAYGAYTDFTGSNFDLTGPDYGNSLTQDYDAAAMTGLGEFSVFSTSPAGSLINGTLTVDYSTFSVDPNDPSFDPSVDTLVADGVFTLPATVSTAPEPATIWLLLGGGVFGLAVALRRRGAAA